MYNPAHPGEILKDLVIEPLNISISEVAEHIGITVNTLSKILDGNSAITPEIALRLEMTFGKPSATHWLKLQNAFDLWQVKRSDINVIPINISSQSCMDNPHV